MTNTTAPDPVSLRFGRFAIRRALDAIWLGTADEAFDTHLQVPVFLMTIRAEIADHEWTEPRLPESHESQLLRGLCLGRFELDRW